MKRVSFDLAFPQYDGKPTKFIGIGKILSGCSGVSGNDTWPSKSWNMLILFPCRGLRIHKRKDVPSMTLNCIWWWGYTSGAFVILEHPVMTITPWIGVVVPVRFPSMGIIDLFKNYLYSIGILDIMQKNI